MNKKKNIFSGVAVGVKVWLCTILVSPFLLGFQSFLVSNKQTHTFGDFSKYQLVILSLGSLLIAAFFLVPCVIHGILSKVIRMKTGMFYSIYYSLVLGFSVTILGYGSLWILLLSRSAATKSGLPEEMLLMFLLQTILWFFVVKNEAGVGMVNQSPIIRE